MVITETGSFLVSDNVLRKYIAELLGTFALVFFGCWSAVIAGKYVGFLGIAFAFGVVVLVRYMP
jgi:glycerol uptake facilitator-like aquaporin